MEHGRLIHLDNNFLTSLPERMSVAHRQVRKWMVDGHRMATSAVAWSEFLRGQSNNQRDATEITYVKEHVLAGGVTPFDERQAEMAAYLFNLAGRPRGSNMRLRLDCMIAACAIESSALLATADINDFRPFQCCGLEFAEIAEI